MFLSKLSEYEEPKKKLCNYCNTWLDFSCFYKNKAKNDGLQAMCVDCVKDYKFSQKFNPVIPKKEDGRKKQFIIPNIYLVGVGRTQTYQNCCLSCEKPFFCMIENRVESDLFCDNCQNKNIEIPTDHISNVYYVGNVIGWIVKCESPSKKRIHRNYKKTYERDKYTCQYCGYNLKNAKKFLPLHIDHVRPHSAHGGNSLNNLVVSCQDCNLLVSNKWFKSFEEKKEFILFEREKKSWRYD